MHLNCSQSYRYSDSRPLERENVDDFDSISGDSRTTVNANEITKNAATTKTKLDINFTHRTSRPSEYFLNEEVLTRDEQSQGPWFLRLVPKVYP